MAETFPEGFLWGVATAAYAIEGAVREDGRGASIWDLFTHLPGTTADGDTGDIACGHYHRWPEDVALMRELGVGAYRLSTAWPRILPEGRGVPNAKGLEFYDRLVDGVMEAGVEPWVCLYHWDLPQALEYRGGWQSRDTASWFADYAQLTARRLGDRVKRWATFNEPAAACIKGYGEGGHAPGVRGRDAALAAIHVMNLAHGLGVAAMRAERADLMLGGIYDFQPVEPADEREEDEIAAQMLDALWNRSFADAQILGRYPEPLAAAIEALVQPGDLDLINQKPDYFGLAHFGRVRARRDPDHPFEVAAAPALPGMRTTATGLEIAPGAFCQAMIAARERYGDDLEVYVLGNGAALPDPIDAEGRIRDESRVLYLREHLAAVLDAVAAGVKVRGYFVSSLLDAFEWTLGYSKRFGLIHVDRETLDRRPKDSFHFYAELAHGAGLDRE